MLRGLIWCVLAGAAGATIVSAHWLAGARAEKSATDVEIVHAMGLIEPSPRRLAAEYTDSQGRLMADPPSTDKLVDPQTLVVAHLPASDMEESNISWPDFEAHLATVTGRQVTDQIYDNSADQMAQMKDGRITLVSLHAADTPFIVNNCGFQPIAVLADGSGFNGNRLDIIVPPDSGISSPANLRDHALVCTAPSSITGYRAAIALLIQNEGLRPNVDYSIIWSLGQKRSITGVASKEYEAAAVSDDKLQSLLAAGDISPSDYKTIYQSEVIPRTTIGWFYNLKPELAARVKDAILSFQPAGPAKSTKKGADNADTIDTTRPLHFVAIDYKKDFDLVRQIDDRFDPRMDLKAKAPKVVATTQP